MSWIGHAYLLCVAAQLNPLDATIARTTGIPKLRQSRSMKSNKAQMAAAAYRLPVLDQDFLLGDSMRGVRFQLEYQKAEEYPAQMGRGHHGRGVRLGADPRGRRQWLV